MAEFSRLEIYMLLNKQKPLWLPGIDLSGVILIWPNLARANMPDGEVYDSITHTFYENGEQ
jgi:hypothetical protein